MRRQRAAVLVAADEPTQTWFQASGCESGQIRPTPDGKIVYGDCKGEFGRYNVETGQEQHYWIYPQQRYGKNPKEMRYRFVRQAPIEIDRAQPQTSSTTGRSTSIRSIDGGDSLDAISPDVTANGPEGHVDVGRADHARHDRRRGVRGAVLDALLAPRARRVLDRIERRPGVGARATTAGPGRT